jgi:periplasmic divalent cation tolerance protein
VQIQIAVPSADVAESLAMLLLERHLCACAQTVGPVTSRYWWKGSLEIAEEHLLLVKTRRALYAAVEATVRAAHPYELPEIVSVPLDPASKPYLDWIASSTASPRKPSRRKAATPRARRSRTAR